MSSSTAMRRSPRITESLMVKALPPVSRHILRGDAVVIATAAQALGLTDPLSPCRAALGGERAWLWLGPDERLVLGPEKEATPLSQVLQVALRALPHALLDVSHRQVALEVTGPTAEVLLAAGCPLDLHPEQFVIGMCTRTILAKAEIVLWRTGEHRFRIEVARSFSDYLSLFLAEAAHDENAR